MTHDRIGSMLLSTVNSLHRIVLASLFIAAIAFAFAVPVPANAQDNEQPVKLGITPVDADGSYFTLEMGLGETREMAVELGNYGEEAIQAQTYAADAYTRVNGGYGTRNAGEPVSGTTLWLDYPAETFDLEPGAAITRDFTVTVPDDAEPGEYLTSLVIQNAEPVGTGGDGDNNITFNQTIRQVIAISITVPGPTTPELGIGGATHKTAGGTSVVSVTVKNPGNVLIKPSGEFILTDVDGEELSRYPVSMDSFYAGTETTIEVPFAEQLNPGDYFASLSLADEEVGVEASAEQIPFSVIDLAAEQAASNPNTAPQRAEVNQEAIKEQTPSTESTGSQPSWILIIALSVVAVGAIAGLAFYAGRRKHGGRDDKIMPTVPRVASVASESAPANPLPRLTAHRGPAKLRPITNRGERA